ncbi:MAG TPA: nucleotide exchange factor GrpE, partial [Actinobacteria bacterium]|nr:nucleotide exchange factor GrpE [Actinomycetota bacterium]
LAKEGLEPIPAEGEAFDPAIHEAVLAPPGGGEDLVVTEELRRGYRMHGKVLRPALVRVDHAGDDA